MTSCVYGEAGPVRRAVRRTAATRPLALLYGRIQQPADTLVYRLTHGRTTLSSWLAGVRLVMLTTTGSRSGLPRTLPLLALRDGEAVVVIASNFGRPRHPAWYHNLRAHPRALVTLDGVTRAVEARELDGAERDRQFRRAVEIYPGFERYRRWASGRRIPVIRLEART
jgi:deazaflavin-dependent oxidoreductase (nitroreductase family)